MCVLFVNRIPNTLVVQNNKKFDAAVTEANKLYVEVTAIENDVGRVRGMNKCMLDPVIPCVPFSLE